MQLRKALHTLCGIRGTLNKALFLHEKPRGKSTTCCFTSSASEPSPRTRERGNKSAFLSLVNLRRKRSTGAGQRLSRDYRHARMIHGLGYAKARATCAGHDRRESLRAGGPKVMRAERDSPWIGGVKMNCRVQPAQKRELVGWAAPGQQPAAARQGKTPTTSEIAPRRADHFLKSTGRMPGACNRSGRAQAR